MAEYWCIITIYKPRLPLVQAPFSLAKRREASFLYKYFMYEKPLTPLQVYYISFTFIPVNTNLNFKILI